MNTQAPSPSSPKAFLKARRPERFSDSIERDVGRLDRAVLEYQLATLNKRSLELAFEDFAKQLCEKVICPNLLAQTGPVAGGDGKVDTQTFPVSEQTQALWFVGVDDNANKDRWAFAVSTQEDWKKKCRKDARKIAGTERGYKKAFLITNQFTKANQRSELEDSLTKETGIDVRILDVSWILDEIFSNGYEQLAIDSLSIDIDWRRDIEVGPNDYAKNCRLQDLQKDIKRELNANDIKPHQLDWLLEEAVLCKELEHPEIESQGRFDRATRTAHRFGSFYHQFSAHYQYAWAAYWWYEDMTLFEEQLQSCFEAVKGIDQSRQWGDFVSLLGLYISYCRHIEDESRLDIEPLRSGVKSSLSKMATDDSRPSNSLIAKAYLDLLKLQDLDNYEEASDIFRSLLDIAQGSERLVGFPFQALYELISGVDDIFGELAEYEVLLDYLTEQATVRHGDLDGALLWLKRGAKRLESGKPYQAIKLVGKSLTGLYKEESRKDIVVALNILSQAYLQVRLPWAARANLLLAASLITDEWWRSGDLIPAQVYAYIRIAKTELLLGRINFALAWWQLACIVDNLIEAPVISDKELQNFDAYMGQIILNTDLATLNTLNTLPDLLDQQQLFTSRSFLLYALGYDEIVSEEYELDIDPEFIKYLLMVRDLDIGAQIPTVNICEGRYVSLNSSVMGCDIKVSFPMRTPLLELAETILAVIEGFFSTCMVDQVVAMESQLDIEITADDDDEICISHELDDTDSVLTIQVLCSSFTPDKLNLAGQGVLQEWLQQFVMEIFAHTLHSPNWDQTAETMLGDDRALERSVSFGACFNSQRNIMGDTAIEDIKALLHNSELTVYNLNRSVPWDKDNPKINESEPVVWDGKSGDGKPPAELLETESLTHSDIEVQGLIKARLWNKARWCGVGFTFHPNETPNLIIVYEDLMAAAAIFKGLRKELGSKNDTNRLRISIIRKFDKKNPMHYRVCISETPSFKHAKLTNIISRINTMTPVSDNNLNRFLDAYEKVGHCILTFSGQKGTEIQADQSIRAMSILISQIHVMDAWQIGPNDIEIAAMHEDDDPIIPEPG